MADGIAPTIDKVDPLTQKTNEEKAQAPALPTGNGAPSFEHAELKKKLEANELNASGAIPDGAGPAVAPPAPKPVEVMSVPETPASGLTPVGQSPRTELNITGENTSIPALSSNGQNGEVKTAEGPLVTNPDPVAPPASETKVTNGPEKLDGSKAPPHSSALKVNGSDDTTAPFIATSGATKDKTPAEDKMEIKPESVATSQLPVSQPTAGTKHKLDDHANGDSATRIEKKPKLTSGDAENGDTKKASKPKKNIVKKALEKVVGRTQRKTRSQGPAGGSL